MTNGKVQFCSFSTFLALPYLDFEIRFPVGVSECRFKIDCTLSSRMLLVFKSRSDKGNIYKKIQWLFQGISKNISEETQLGSFTVIWFHMRKRAFVEMALF